MMVAYERNVLPVTVVTLRNLQNNCNCHLQTIVCGFLIFCLMVHMPFSQNVNCVSIRDGQQKQEIILLPSAYLMLVCSLWHMHVTALKPQYILYISVPCNMSLNQTDDKMMRVIWAPRVSHFRQLSLDGIFFLFEQHIILYLELWHSIIRDCLHLGDFKNLLTFLNFHANSDGKIFVFKQMKKITTKKGSDIFLCSHRAKLSGLRLQEIEIWVDLLKIFQRRRILRHQDSCLEKWSGLH